MSSKPEPTQTTREQRLESALRMLIHYAKDRQSDCTGCCGKSETREEMEARDGWDTDIQEAVKALS